MATSKSSLYDMVQVLFNNFKKNNPDQKIIKDDRFTISVDYIEETVKNRPKEKN